MQSLRKRVRPGVSKRDDFPLESSRSALLIIDVQTYLTTPPPDASGYFWEDATIRMISNLKELTSAFRAIRENQGGCEVIFTFLQSATNDGRDISLDYKLSGPELANIPHINDSNLFLKELEPSLEGKGGILLPKTSCSVFVSTNLDYLLRNLCVEQLCITGQLTDQCVESAVRDAADLGYFVTVVDDACAAKSLNSHVKGLASMKGFCRICNTAQIIQELAMNGKAKPCDET